jgi:hypothetical protein
MSHRAVNPEEEEERIDTAVMLLHITCIDVDLGRSVYTSEADLSRAMARYLKARPSLPAGHPSKWSKESKVPPRTWVCKNGELPSLRRLLARNAQRLVVPQWQKDLIAGGPELSATFLLPLYSGKVSLAEYRLPMTVALVVEKKLESDPHTPPVVEGMSCLLCGKPASMRCSRCRRVFYCGAACQKKAWPEHKKTCKAP